MTSDVRKEMTIKPESRWASRKFSAFLIATALTGILSIYGQPEYAQVVVAFLGFAAAYTTGQAYVDGKRV